MYVVYVDKIAHCLGLRYTPRPLPPTTDPAADADLHATETAAFGYLRERSN
jgi:hypothetical protein